MADTKLGKPGWTEGKKGRTVWDRATERPPLVDYEEIQYISTDYHVAVITLLRPAFNRKMKEELSHALWERFNYADEDKALVITGIGTKMFSGGEDIEDIDPEWDRYAMRLYAEETLDLYHKIIKGILLVDKPVIAALNGTAAGSGLSIALACDERFALHCTGERSPRYYKLVPGFSKLGLVPDCGITETLPRLIGAKEADKWFEPSFEIEIYRAKDAWSWLFREIAMGGYGDAHTSKMHVRIHKYITEDLLKRSPAEYAALKQRRNRDLLDRLSGRDGAFQWEKNHQAACLMNDYSRRKIREFKQAKFRKEVKSNG